MTQAATHREAAERQTKEAEHRARMAEEQVEHERAAREELEREVARLKPGGPSHSS